MPQLSGVSRLRLSPGEVERLLKDEKERRRKLRIMQVREKSRHVAKSKLEAVKREKVRQLEKLAEKIEEEWEVERQIRIEQLEQEYSESLKSIGTAHTQADELDLGLERKAVAIEENNKRAEERYAVAVAKLKEDKQIEEAESEAVIQARELAMAKERLRARVVASMPPSIQPDLRKALTKAKSICVQLTDADTYSYPHQLPADEFLVDKNDDSFKDGLVGAEEENVRRNDIWRETSCTKHERLEKARVRGAHALKRERMRQDYNNMMNELDLLEKADRKHRQQNLEHIPQSLYLPAHVVAEREADRQTNMERKIEDIFTDEFDNMDLRAYAPPLNYDITPTVTELSSGSPSDVLPKPPISRVRDSEADRSRAPLRNVTNVTSTGTESTDTETGSEKKRKMVLKKMMKTIDRQKQHWVEHDDILDDLVNPSQSPHESTAKLRPPSSEERVAEVTSDERTEETSNESLQQVTESSSGGQTEEQISQTRASGSEGETTTSSQFIERQRQELVDYMKSLESQIVDLEALKRDKEALDKDEDLAARLEAKLAQKFDSTEDTSISATQKTLEQTTSAESSEQTTSSSMYQEAQVSATSADTQSSIYRPVKSADSLERRPDESTWDWYLRQKSSLGESIKEKLHKITSNERGYQLDTADYGSYPPQPLILPQHTTDLTSLYHPASVITQNVRPVPSDMAADYRAAAERVLTPPAGYVSVSEREEIARGNTLPSALESSYGGGYKLHGNSTIADPQQEPFLPPSEYLPVEERERLITTPTTAQDGHENLSYSGRYQDQLQQDLHEHSQRLARLQELMSATRSDQFTQSAARFKPRDQSAMRTDILGQSAARAEPFNQSARRAEPLSQSARRTEPFSPIKTSTEKLSRSATRFNVDGQSSVRFEEPSVPKAQALSSAGSYMSVEERENLIRTAASRLLARDERGTSSVHGQPTWRDVLSTKPSKPDKSDGLQQQMSGVSLHTPPLAVTPVKETQTSTATAFTTAGDFGGVPNMSSVNVPSAGATTGWSGVHQQMLARQQEFNRKQEELRRQLADIQEQKRKLLAPTNEQELHDTRDQLRRTLEGLGIDLENDPAMQSTPAERRSRPYLSGLEPHELSVIAEVDTPTHLTSYDESTLLNSLNNVDVRASLTRESSNVPTPSITSSEPIERQRVNSQPISDEDTGAQLNINSNAQNISASGSESGHVDVPSKSHSVEELAMTPTSDDDRMQVLNQLLQQLESRRAQRQSFLEQEKLTTLLDKSDSQSLPETAERSPRITDLYSSDSAEDAMVQPSISGSVGSTTSKDEQTKDSGKEWIQKSILMPRLEVERLLSSGSASPCSERMGRLYTTHTGSGQRGSPSTSSTSDVSPRVQNVEDILQTTTSESSHCSRGRDISEPLVTLSLSSKSSTPSGISPQAADDTAVSSKATSALTGKATSAQTWKATSALTGKATPALIGKAMPSQTWKATPALTESTFPVLPPSTALQLSSSSEGTQSPTTSPRIQHLRQLLQTITMAEESGSEKISGSDGQTLSQGSEHSSPSSRGREITQVTDPSLAFSVQDETAVTLGRDSPCSDISSGSIATPMRTLSDDEEPSIPQGSHKVEMAEFQAAMDSQVTVGSSTPMKVVISRPTSSTPHNSPPQEQVSGPLEEQEITFASTVADGTLVEDPHASDSDLDHAEGSDLEPAADENTQPVVPGLQWVEEPPAAVAEVERSMPPPDVRPKTAFRNVDSATRKKRQKEMSERTKRLYSQLEEVKERKAYKAREDSRVDVQARRKEYANRLQARAKKS